MYLYKTLIYTVFFLFPSLLFAHEINSKNYTVDNGLPSSEVYHVIQDQKGFMWFATDEGVSRFDGYNFENFTNLEGLPDNTVLEIYEDYKGRIWFISISGRLSWYENDSIHIYPYNDQIEKRLSGSNFPIKRSFLVDSSDNIYIGFYNYLILKIYSNGRIEEFGRERDRDYIKLIDNRVIYNYRSLSNKITIHKSANLFFSFKLDVKRISANRTFAYYTNKTLLYSDYKTLYVVDTLGNKSVITFDKPILWISSDKNNAVWIGLLNAGAVAYKNLDFKNKIYHLAEGSSVSSIFDDNENGFWVTTLENGVYYYPDLNIKHITKKDGLNNSVVNVITKNNQKIYFGGDNLEYYEFDLETLTEHKVKTNLNPKSCKMMQWLGDTLILGNDRGGTNFIYNDEIINHIKTSYRKAVQINTDSLILFYSNKVLYYVGKPVYSIYLKNVSNIFDATILNDSIIFLGTDIGLIRFNFKSRSYTKVDKFKELHNRINCLYKENDVMWIGTKGAGLLKLHQDTLYKYSINDGLPGNSVRSILKNDSVYILGTNNGLAQVKFNDAHTIYDITIFNSGHGLLTNGVKDIEILKDKLLVATQMGISYLDKNIKGKPSHIYITKFKVTGHDTELKKHYDLAHNQNFIEISYVTLNYKRNQPIQYLYKLEGLDRNWNRTEDLTVRYALLPPGNYKFIVKSINSFGKKTTEPAVITFKIHKAYYQTILFKVVVILISLIVVLAILLLIFRIRIREIRNRNKLESELNKYRQRALSAQMNPHFIFNSLNSIQNYILKNEPLKSSDYLSSFGALMRRVLVNSQTTEISLKEELEALRLYIELELLRFQNDFYCEYNISEKINLEEIKVPPLILQPFVENAIHHGLRLKKSDKKISISIFEENQRVYIYIEDNGVGRRAASKISHNKKHKSYGSDITNKRLNIYSELYKNDVKIKYVDLISENEMSTGTRVEIEFNNLSNNKSIND